MNFKRYHVSKNLFDGVLHEGFYDNTGQLVIDTSGAYHSDLIRADEATYTISGLWSGNPYFAVYEWDVNKQWLRRSNRQIPNGNPITFTLGNNCVYFSLQINSNYNYLNIMLNTGLQPLPYEPYDTEVWHDMPYYIHNTSTDTLTTLPAVLYPNDTTATIGLKGNAVQNGTPTSDNPIMPQGCGELDAGQYKIPILNNSQTTNVYLGEVQSTRRIKKYEFTGNENWSLMSYGTGNFSCSLGNYLHRTKNITICSHYKTQDNVDGIAGLANKTVCFYYSSAYPTASSFYAHDTSYTTVDAWKQHLADKYAAGMPVTIWYILATDTTGIVNEPLMRIGDYADSISGISIPTIAGANTLDVLTTLKPSEVTASFNGWHPVSSAHERSGGAWD